MTATTIDMSPRTLMRELAYALRDVIREAPEDHIEAHPEDAFIDLACSFVLRLSRSALQILPIERRAKTAAAERTFDILTTWLQEHPEGSYAMKFDPAATSLPFRFEVRPSPEALFVFFGGDAQDAQAQAAQAIEFEALS